MTVFAAVMILLPSLAHAHAFGSRYELPVPVWLFVGGGAATMTLTLVLLSVFVRTEATRYTTWRYDLLRHAFVRQLVHTWSFLALKWAAVALLLMVVLAGFVGTQDPNRNIAPTLVWVVWWVGFSYLAMLIGNIWPVINPWRTIFEWAFAAKDSSSRMHPGHRKVEALHQEEAPDAQRQGGQVARQVRSPDRVEAHVDPAAVSLLADDLREVGGFVVHDHIGTEFGTAPTLVVRPGRHDRRRSRRLHQLDGGGWNQAGRQCRRE